MQIAGTAQTLQQLYHRAPLHTEGAAFSHTGPGEHGNPARRRMGPAAQQGRG